MIKITDKNRDDILDKYCERLLDSMDSQTIMAIAYDSIRDSRDMMDNKPLEDEILEFCPYLLEE